MTEADLPLGMRLKASNGWNQTEADWRRYLDLQPDGCFLATFDDKPVGTLTTCIFGSVGWIAMVLVDSEYRGRGIGTALMRHALEFLEQQDVSSARLDATPLGQPIYEKLGFVAEYALHRYEGILPPKEPKKGTVTLSSKGQSPFSHNVEPLVQAHVQDLLMIDRETTRTDRQKLLLRLASEFPQAMRVLRGTNAIEGFRAARPGARAFQIGPCVARGPAGRQLLEDVRQQYGGEHVFLDIPDDNGPAVRWAEETGLSTQRRLLRMCRGRALDERVADLWASSGPEMG
jgi:GNAT superfamily N-acetyltransferase